jgi:NitT/TauT family transport system ATP-binding protein
VEGPRVRLTIEGIGFGGADIQESKRIFARAAMDRVPLIRVIRAGLERCSDGCLQAGFFRDILRRNFGEEQATEQLEIVAQWGRYAELFEYDAIAQQFCIERDSDEPEQGVA